jgi:chromate transporter
MHRELVDEKRWISEARFLHALNYCMVLPGPEAQQLATYIGWLMHRTWGGVVAGALFVLPSLGVLIALSWIYVTFGDVPAVAGVLYGIKPAVVAIVLQAAWRIGSRALKHPVLWVIAAAAFAAIFVFHVPFPAIVITAAIAGVVLHRVLPRAFAGASHGPAANATHPPALIDDRTPTPAHARFSVSRLARVIVVCAVLWMVPFGLLAMQGGFSGTLGAMAWFFTKAALLTFGGAYAVLPYVYQGAVETFGWLSPTQMIDGLALGETTPGPLIMVVAFVGFVGAYSHPAFAAATPLASAIAGACTATYFTFLPSFLFILAGGPLVESTHGNVALAAPLTGITAAVVGVIVSLAAFFAQHVFWPDGLVDLGAIDYFALVLCVAALAALVRWKRGVIPVLMACGAAGLLRTLAM